MKMDYSQFVRFAASNLKLAFNAHTRSSIGTRFLGLLVILGVVYILIVVDDFEFLQ